MRVYHPDAKVGTITLERDQVRHLKVLRVKEGDQITVFDGQGNEFEGNMIDLKGRVRVENQVKAREEPKVRITLATAVPKGGRMDVLVEKVSEIGARNIVPIFTKRAVVLPREAKIERLQRIAIEGCSQSGRATLTTVEKPVDFEQMLKRVKEFDACVIMSAAGRPLKEVYNGEGNVLVLVGPEGDFDPEEYNAAVKAGCKPASLGPTILRVETAAIAVCTQLVMLAEHKL